MMIKHCVYKKVYDNIPGFRDTEITKIECFDKFDDAETLKNKLNEIESGSKPVTFEEFNLSPDHDGSIDTYFFVKTEES